MDDSLKQLHAYLEMMLRRKWLIGILLVICTGFAVATAFRINPTYRSTTVILVEKQQIPESYVTPTD
ncbi:MAG: Wzz/FepE/Etk N-terminal domain-containing protein, partial [Sedimentisphaerales bacterium]|nr:Wzz/FepE/Etk N-terminal domain-containing protein [Sedimentisphaerales bacterium]